MKSLANEIKIKIFILGNKNSLILLGKNNLKNKVKVRIKNITIPTKSALSKVVKQEIIKIVKIKYFFSQCQFPCLSSSKSKFSFIN
jgi:hypothetical protein